MNDKIGPDIITFMSSQYKELMESLKHNVFIDSVYKAMVLKKEKVDSIIHSFLNNQENWEEYKENIILLKEEKSNQFNEIIKGKKELQNFFKHDKKYFYKLGYFGFKLSGILIKDYEYEIENYAKNIKRYSSNLLKIIYKGKEYFITMSLTPIKKERINFITHHEGSVIFKEKEELNTITTDNIISLKKGEEWGSKNINKPTYIAKEDYRIPSLGNPNIDLILNTEKLVEGKKVYLDPECSLHEIYLKEIGKAFIVFKGIPADYIIDIKIPKKSIKYKGVKTNKKILFVFNILKKKLITKGILKGYFCTNYRYEFKTKELEIKNAKTDKIKLQCLNRTKNKEKYCEECFNELNKHKKYVKKSLEELK